MYIYSFAHRTLAKSKNVLRSDVKADRGVGCHLALRKNHGAAGTVHLPTIIHSATLRPAMDRGNVVEQACKNACSCTARERSHNIVR
jgi:hypothetical protein